jgi:hypothetical protein
MRLPAVPIAAAAVIAIIIVEVDESAPEPAMVPEVAISFKRAEIVEVGSMAYHVAPAAMPMTSAAVTAAMTAANKHKGDAAADRSLLLPGRYRIGKSGICQQGHAKNRCSGSNSFNEHGVPF